MARVILTAVNTYVGVRITNNYNDGSFNSVLLFPDDLVDELEYVENQTVKSATGRLDKVNISPKLTRAATNRKGRDICDTCNVDNIIIDASDVFQSNLITVPSREILEYMETSKDIARVDVDAELKVHVKISLSDGTSSETDFVDGQRLLGVTIMEKGKEFTADYMIDSFIYSMNARREWSASGMNLIDAIGGTRAVAFTDLKSVGKKAVVIETAEDIQRALEQVANPDNESAGISMPEMTVTAPITIASNANISGAMAGIPANKGERCTDEILEGETVVENTITFNKGADITVQGLTLSKDSRINLSGASVATMKNCRFLAAEPSEAKTMLFKDDFANSSDEAPVQLQFDGCYFGTNKTATGKKVYHVFEFNCTIADGSYIRNCYFAEDACTHNVINVYDIAEGATMDIENNTFEISRNAIRVGVRGNKNATINIRNNTWLKTDDYNDGEYAGLLICQPYGEVTTGMNGITINLDDNINKSGYEQLYYCYEGSSKVGLTKELIPHIFVNGVDQEFAERG